MLKLYFYCDTPGCSSSVSKLERDSRRVPDRWSDSLPPRWMTADGKLSCPECAEDRRELPELEKLIAAKYPNWTVARFSVSRSDRPILGIHDPAVRWNNFACPLFGRHAAWRIVQWLNGRQKRVVASMGASAVFVDPGPDAAIGFSDEKQIYHADEDGLFPIGSRRWGWLVIE
jgi:hypothetical protein